MDIIEDDILNGIYEFDSIIISTTEISKVFSVNPTTVIKAISMLADKGFLYKRRGIGMAVTQEAKEIILFERKNLFFNTQLKEFISSANKLGIDKEQLAQLILKSNFEENIDND